MIERRFSQVGLFRLNLAATLCEKDIITKNYFMKDYLMIDYVMRDSFILIKDYFMSNFSKKIIERETLTKDSFSLKMDYFENSSY